MDPAATRRVARGAAVKALAHFKAQRRFEKPAAFGPPARSRAPPASQAASLPPSQNRASGKNFGLRQNLFPTDSVIIV